MSKIGHTLNGSTLVETLVMMLVAGIIFLSVMDGLTLFTRMQAQRAEALLAAGRETTGYYRIAALAASTDSTNCHADRIELFRNSHKSVLLLRDSSLVVLIDEFCDTLMTHIGTLQLRQYDRQADTIEVRFAAGFTAKFAIPKSRRNKHRRSIEHLESDYDYQEK